MCALRKSLRHKPLAVMASRFKLPLSQRSVPRLTDSITAGHNPRTRRSYTPSRHIPLRSVDLQRSGEFGISLQGGEARRREAAVCEDALEGRSSGISAHLGPVNTMWIPIDGGHFVAGQGALSVVYLRCMSESATPSCGKVAPSRSWPPMRPCGVVARVFGATKPRSLRLAWPHWRANAGHSHSVNKP